MINVTVLVGFPLLINPQGRISEVAELREDWMTGGVGLGVLVLVLAPPIVLS